MKPLVLVHGFLGGSAQWTLQAPLFENRQVICIDLPGFGENADLPPINRIEGFATYVLDHLTASNVEQFDLLGHSMGGMVVQEMIHLAPERVASLVLYATGSVGVLPGRFEPIETSMERARRDGAAATARRIAATWFLKSDQSPEFEGCAEIAHRAGLAAMLAGLDAMKVWSGEPHLSDIKADTLIIWGERDRTYQWPQIEALWRGIKQSHLAVIPECAHAVHLERPDIFNAVLGQFLNARSGRTSF